jgi:hypothetical protein
MISQIEELNTVVPDAPLSNGLAIEDTPTNQNGSSSLLHAG